MKRKVSFFSETMATLCAKLTHAKLQRALYIAKAYFVVSDLSRGRGLMRIVLGRIVNMKDKRIES